MDGGAAGVGEREPLEDQRDLHGVVACVDDDLALFAGAAEDIAAGRADLHDGALILCAAAMDLDGRAVKNDARGLALRLGGGAAGGEQKRCNEQQGKQFLHGSSFT